MHWLRSRTWMLSVAKFYVCKYLLPEDGLGSFLTLNIGTLPRQLWHDSG